MNSISKSISSIQSLSCVSLFVTPWSVACQPSLSIINAQSLLKFMSMELVMPSNHLILCRHLLCPPSIFPLRPHWGCAGPACLRVCFQSHPVEKLLSHPAIHPETAPFLRNLRCKRPQGFDLNYKSRNMI